jgi:hypothetical protein
VVERSRAFSASGLGGGPVFFRFFGGMVVSVNEGAPE